jgi:hypothetical protein
MNFYSILMMILSKKSFSDMKNAIKDKISNLGKSWACLGALASALGVRGFI